MAEVTGKTSEEIDELLEETIISGRVEGGNLILTTRGGADILAGFIGTGAGGGGGPVDPGPGADALSYENAAPNQIFVVHRSASSGDWPAVRPSARGDIYFEATGPMPPPAWLLSGKDRMAVPMGEGGLTILPGDVLSPDGGGTGFNGQTLETALPGSLFVIYKGAGWPTTRPSSRTDIFFELVGADPSPGWMLSKDRRGIPKP